MKKNNIFYFSLLFVCMACSSQEKTILDETRVDSLNIISVKCKNNIDNMTYLMGGVALKSEGLTVAKTMGNQSIPTLRNLLKLNGEKKKI